MRFPRAKGGLELIMACTSISCEGGNGGEFVDIPLSDTVSICIWGVLGRHENSLMGLY